MHILLYNAMMRNCLILKSMLNCNIMLIASFQLVFIHLSLSFSGFTNPTQCCAGTESRVLFDIPNARVISGVMVWKWYMFTLYIICALGTFLTDRGTSRTYKTATFAERKIKFSQQLPQKAILILRIPT